MQDPQIENNEATSRDFILDRAAWVRRADVSLRTHYPNLVTRIFEIGPQQFVIVFDKALQDVNEVDFDKVRPITLNASISNDLPTDYLREIPPLPDRDIAHNFEGFPFNNSQLLNLIAGRFRDLPIVSIRDGGTPMTVTVELTHALEAELERELLTFCNGIGVPAPFRLSVTGRDSLEATPPIPRPSNMQEDALFIGASRLRPSAPSFVRADEAFWFDNLDRICAGGLAVEDMPGIEEGQARCFVDATNGEHVNFRQLLTLYDTIYMSPPLREGHEAFLAKQALSEDDLLTLIECGRLKLLGTQAEERLKIPFLDAAAERSASALIGRRATAALMIADLVRTADRYCLRNVVDYAAVGKASKLLGERSGLPADEILQFLLWPVQARRASIWPLLDRGSKGIMPIGVGPIFATFIEKVTKKDLALECLMLSEPVHIGHALNATVFPRREQPEGWHALANAMGDVLNFFRSFNTEIGAAWVGNVERKEAGNRLLPPLPLFEFDPAIPIEEILGATERTTLRNRGRALFNRIADLTEDDRATEIRQLNADLRKYGRPSGIISLDTADTGIGLASTAFGFPYPPLAGLRTLGAQLAEFARKSPALDRLFEQIQSDMFPGGARKREFDFLSRISRVASLKTEKIF